MSDEKRADELEIALGDAAVHDPRAAVTALKVGLDMLAVELQELKDRVKALERKGD